MRPEDTAGADADPGQNRIIGARHAELLQPIIGEDSAESYLCSHSLKLFKESPPERGAVAVRLCDQEHHCLLPNNQGGSGTLSSPNKSYGALMILAVAFLLFDNL